MEEIIYYKEMQRVFKEIAVKSMLDKDYRDLCLQDSRTAIQKIVNSKIAIPDNIIFLEEDREPIDGESVVYILPPFLKSSWILNN